MPWFRPARPSDDRDRLLAYDAQQMVQAHEQTVAAVQQAYALPVDQENKERDLAPVAGVTVQHYAEICRAINTSPTGNARMAAIAQAHGVDAASWHEAFGEWNTRFTRTVAAAEAFVVAYGAT